MSLTRCAVVREALRLLDDEGLDGLSLRRLAERLGVRAPTLYWHVRDKRQLLDLVAAEILRQTFENHRFPTPGQPWEEWLAARARSLRTSLLAHRDSARVLAGNRPPPDALGPIEQALAGLVDAGFSAADALRALFSLGSFVMGEVLDAQGEATRGAEPAAHTLVRDEAGTILPFLRDAVPSVLGRADDRFEFGLGLLIAGLRARRDARPPGRPGDRPR